MLSEARQLRHPRGIFAVPGILLGLCVAATGTVPGREIFLCKGFTQATPTNPFTSIVD